VSSLFLLRLRSFEADVGRELSCSSLTLPAVALLPSKMLPSLCHNRSPSSPTSTPTIRACCAPSQVKQREFPAKMRTTARGGRGGAVAGRGNLGRETAARAVARQQVKFLSTEKTRERAREGVMTREERLLGEMRATTLAREKRMEIEREREREHVQEIVRMRAREREVGVSYSLTSRTLHVKSLARMRARARSRSLCPARSLAFFLPPPPSHPSSPSESLSPHPIF
jgi:hypothetical protein